MSVDGFLAPPGVGLTDPDPAELQAWLAQWSRLQDWVFHQDFFRKNLKLPGGGETGDDDKMLREVFDRTGVTIMGKRTFDGDGIEGDEPERSRDPRQAGRGAIESALRQAREVANGRDIRIGGGGDTLAQYLRAGLVDEFHVALSPVMLGKGVRLFDHIPPSTKLVPLPAPQSKRVTHLVYRVERAKEA